MQLRDLSLVFITHMHSDHYLELGPLLHTAWTAGLKTPVVIWGPAGLVAYWDAFLLSMKADIDLRIEDEGDPICAILCHCVIDAGQFFARDGLTVDALRNEHPPLIDTFALRFETARRSVVFSGDTACFPPLADFARGADLLIHEAMLEAALGPLMARIGNGDDRLMKHWLRAHTLADDAARLATQAGVKALALHHLIPSDDPDFTESHWRDAVAPHWAGPFHLGRDGMRIALE